MFAQHIMNDPTAVNPSSAEFLALLEALGMRPGSARAEDLLADLNSHVAIEDIVATYAAHSQDHSQVISELRAIKAMQYVSVIGPASQGPQSERAE
jgi:hypothetical protein